MWILFSCKPVTFVFVYLQCIFWTFRSRAWERYTWLCTECHTRLLFMLFKRCFYALCFILSCAGAGCAADGLGEAECIAAIFTLAPLVWTLTGSGIGLSAQTRVGYRIRQVSRAEETLQTIQQLNRQLYTDDIHIGKSVGNALSSYPNGQCLWNIGQRWFSHNSSFERRFESALLFLYCITCALYISRMHDSCAIFPYLNCNVYTFFL